MKEFDEYARDAINYKPAFKQIGVQMIRFAMERPQLFQQVWVHTFGICVLCASKVCSFSEEELDEMMIREFMAAMMLIKSGRMNQCVVKSEREQQYS